jgi:hypothetical protein
LVIVRRQDRLNGNEFGIQPLGNRPPRDYNAEVMEDLVRIFAGLEQQWADSIQRKDLDTLRHRFLTEDFALRISDDAS